MGIIIALTALAMGANSPANGARYTKTDILCAAARIQGAEPPRKKNKILQNFIFKHNSERTELLTANRLQLYNFRLAVSIQAKENCRLFA